jgi:hypothetical protein
MANARAGEDSSPIVSNMVPEEKLREEDMVTAKCFLILKNSSSEQTLLRAGVRHVA